MPLEDSPPEEAGCFTDIKQYRRLPLKALSSLMIIGFHSRLADKNNFIRWHVKLPRSPENKQNKTLISRRLHNLPSASIPECDSHYIMCIWNSQRRTHWICMGLLYSSEHIDERLAIFPIGYLAVRISFLRNAVHDETQQSTGDRHGQQSIPRVSSFKCCI